MYNRALALIKEKDIEAVELSKTQITAYKREWFDRFVPSDKQRMALDCYCLSENGYLWHVFSYNLLECLSLDEARKALDETEKQGAVLLSDWDGAAYLLKDAFSLRSSDIEEITDVILTDEDFTWTYVKTHESDCGPYFYAIRRNF